VYKVKRRVITFCFLAILVLPAVSCTQSQSGSLPPVEIKEYQGEKLSSIDDFRENSIKGIQKIDANTYRLKVTGLVKNADEYTYSNITTDFQKYEKLITLDCVEGWSVKILWEGVLLKDLLTRADALPDARVVIFHAYDGYTTSFPVEYILNNDIIMAYKMNGVFIPPERGFPFQLVAESKWGYKWIKWITQIELSDNADYRGYWEQRGYSNSGDVDKDMFE